jgi:hypothetical protein
MRYLTEFDSKTLHDGSNRWSKGVLPINMKADAGAVQMANGSLFDPHYGTGATATPQPFTAAFLMKFATEAAAEAEIAALKAKIGDNGTATSNFDSGATAETCNATLESVNIQPSRNGRAFRAVLHFVPFDDWS